MTPSPPSPLSHLPSNPRRERWNEKANLRRSPYDGLQESNTGL